MKKKFLSLLTSVALITQAISPTLVKAEETPISVYVDNEKIYFETTQPIIMNDRTMVPVRETAEKLGFDVNWDPSQSTFGLISNDVFVTHKLNSNAVTVNGEQLVFDTTSVIMDDYSLLPIVMLQMSLGATISWDEATRSVRISTDSEDETSSNNSSSNSKDDDDDQPMIFTTFDETIVARQNQAVSFTVLASDFADSVRLVASNSQILADSSEYKERSNGREFELSFIPQYVTLSDARYTLQAAVGKTYNTVSDFPVFVKVNAGIKIESATVTGTSTTRGSQVIFNVTGNEGVTRVRIVNEDDDIVAESDSPIGGASDITPDFRMYHDLDFAGEQDFRVFAGDDDGYNDDYELITFSVDEDEEDEEDEIDGLEIIDIYLEEDEIDIDDDLEIEITTSDACQYVEIYDESNNRLARTTSYSTLSSGNRLFTFETSPEEEGTYYIYVRAYLERYGDDYIEEKVKITVGDDSSDTGKLYSHSCSPSYVYSGEREYVDFEFVTSSDVKYIDIYDVDGDILETIEDYSYKSNSKYYWETEIRVRLYDDEELTYKVYYNSGASSKSGTIDLSVK